MHSALASSQRSAKEDEAMSKRKTERRALTQDRVRNLAIAPVGGAEAVQVVGGETKQPEPKKPAPTPVPYLTITLENTMISG